MAVLLRLVIAAVAITVGNLFILAADALETQSVTAQIYTLKMFCGTVLVVAGAFLLARTVVTFVKSRLSVDE